MVFSGFRHGCRSLRRACVGFAWTREACGIREASHRALSSSQAYSDVVKHSYEGVSGWGRVIGAAFVAGTGTALYYSNLDKTPASCGGPGVAAGAHRPEMPTFSKEEVAKHKTKDTGIWVTYKDGVYDVTDWVDIHPGGASRLMLAAGGPIDPFWAMYAQHNTEQVQSILEEYRLGNLEGGGSVAVGNPYENEPTDRHPSLVVRSTTPMNSETPMELLGESLVTPNDLFFIRNHLPVPDIDGNEYSFEVEGEGLKRLSLSLDDLKSNFKKHSITVTIQCTGNRRKDMMDTPSPKEIKGLEWQGAAIGTAVWGGVLLRDVLKEAGSTYGASIPLAKAMDVRGDCKWLKKIEASRHESESFWQQRDYKTFSPNVDWDTVDWTSSPAIQSMPVTSAITYPAPGFCVERDGDDDLTVTVKGYAWSGGGNGIIRVDVSTDDGKTWQDASLKKVHQQSGRAWAWTLWECDVEIPKGHIGPLDIVAKATDESCNTQPERAEGIWNLRGVVCNTWPRIRIDIKE
eukprot:jgi/Picre1/30753/NNA_006114.t1